MSKRKPPHILYPDFWKKPSPNIIPAKIYKTGTTLINTAITGRDWFKETPFYKEIKSKTSFLDETCDFSERLFCYKNEYDNVPLCPITKTPLKWSKQKHRYLIGSNPSARALLCNKNIDKVKVILKTKYKNNRDNLYKKYKSKEFKLLEKNELKKYIETFVKNGKFTQLYNTNFTNDIDELCSILYYTEKYNQYMNYKNVWSARMYIIYNNFYNVLDEFLEKYNTLPSYFNFKMGFGKRPHIFKNIKENNKFLWKEIIEKQNFSIINENYLTESSKRRTILKCNICGEVFDRNLSSGMYFDIICPGCNGEPSVSNIEKNLREEISNFYKGEIIFNDRKILNGKELDIYIPDKKIAIELNGVLWHSFGSSWPNNLDKENVEKDKHYKKYKLCEKLGIQLLQFTDIDYFNKKEIILNIIKAKLGISDVRIYARKCEIKEISKKQKSEFCAANHLQGDTHSQIEYGLFYNNELVSIMTFGKRKITKGKPKMEIIRYCNKLNYNVIGGASKLLKHFIKNNQCSTLITYADNSISNGNVYKQLGFTLTKETKWNYWYFSYNNHNKLLHRSNFMRHKLNTKLTEKEEMYNRGYRRYYDAGNKVFEMIIAKD